MFRHHTAEQIVIKIDNTFFKNAANFKHFGATGTNQNFIHEETKADHMWKTFSTFQLKIFCLPSATAAKKYM
jgi:hypothetical protein